MTHSSPLLLLFILSNLAITAGYVYLAFAVIPKVKIRLKRTKVGGVGFFLLCGITHLMLALGPVFDNSDVTMAETGASWLMLAVHVPQAICVWLFAGGLFIEIGDYGLLALRKDKPKPPSS